MGSTNREIKHEVFDDVQDKESRVRPPTSQRRMSHKKDRMKIRNVLKKLNYDDWDTFVDEFEE